MSSLFTSKFISTIKTLSKTELKAFDNWLKSPWCNSNKNLIQLLDKLKKYYPTFNNSKLTKEKLFKQVLPNGKYSDRRINNLLSEGYLAAEQFLIFNNLRSNQNLQKDLLSQEFQNRHLEDWFFRDINKEIKRLEDKPAKSWEDHFSLFQFHRRIYHHPNQHPRMQAGSKTIIRMKEELDLLYLLEKATIINEMIFRNRMLKNENHEVSFEVAKWQTASRGLEHLSIEIYFHRFEYTHENMLEKYNKIRDIFLERYKELPPKEQKVHLISLLNDTILLAKAKKISIAEGLPLYKLGLSTGILLHQDILPQSMYCTIVAAGNLIKDFEFSEMVIEKYSKKLKKNYQEDAYWWGKAHTAYRQDKLEQSLDLSLAHPFATPQFQLMMKVLTTQIYFDLHLKNDSYQSYLFNYFDAFEKSILRNKTRSETSKKGYLRFIQICRALAKYHIDVNFDLKKVKNLLINESNIQAPKWLAQKIEEVIALKTTH